jgi:hypothetical protein
MEGDLRRVVDQGHGRCIPQGPGCDKRLTLDDWLLAAPETKSNLSRRSDTNDLVIQKASLLIRNAVWARRLWATHRIHGSRVCIGAAFRLELWAWKTSSRTIESIPLYRPSRPEATTARRRVAGRLGLADPLTHDAETSQSQVDRGRRPPATLRAPTRRALFTFDSFLKPSAHVGRAGRNPSAPSSGARAGGCACTSQLCLECLRVRVRQMRQGCHESVSERALHVIHPAQRLPCQRRHELRPGFVTFATPPIGLMRTVITLPEIARSASVVPARAEIFR